MLVNEKVSFDHNSPGGWAQMPSRITKVTDLCRPGECSRKFCWYG